jgi:chromosome segregation ATPase
MVSNEELSTLRINLDLETGPFKKNLQTVKAGMTALRGEYNNLTQFNKKYQNSLEGLQANSDRLTKTMDLQKQRIQLLKSEYKDLSGRLGENSQEALRMRAAYENAQGKLKQMEAELSNTNKRIQEQSSEWAKVSTITDKTVKSMQSQLGVLNSDYKVLTAGVKNFGSKTADLQTQSSHLVKTLDLESSTVNALKKKYDEAVRSKGADAQETQAAKIAMNEAIISMKNTESELSKVNSKIEFQASSWGRLNTKLETYKTKAGEVSEKAKNVGDGITGAFGPATAVMGAGLGVAAKKAMDFEQEMSNVKSVMSPDDVKNYGGELSKLAITMGAKTKYKECFAA